MANLNDTSPIKQGEAVTPSDSTVIETTRCLHVGGGGDLAVQFVDGGTVTLAGVSPGYHPLCVKKVRATGTTATGIVALY
jgi:hypothetical protein